MTPPDDDLTLGHILSRRELIALAGASFVSPSAGRFQAPVPAPGRLPQCVVRPAQTEGPYFVEERLDRADIRGEPNGGSPVAGTPLQLAFQVSRMSGAACTPLAGALVDLWQCDARGFYSDVRDQQGLFDTRGQKFLRGHQRTGNDGRAVFTTIYPGWYPGRAVHIHFKIRTAPEGARGTEFTSQLYFDDALSDRVLAAAPYSTGRRVRNEGDGIYRRGGQQLRLDLTAMDGGGYRGTFDVGLMM